MSNAPSKTFFCSLRSWLMYKTLTIHFINLTLNLRVWRAQLILTLLTIAKIATNNTSGIFLNITTYRCWCRWRWFCSLSRRRLRLCRFRRLCNNCRILLCWLFCNLVVICLIRVSWRSCVCWRFVCIFSNRRFWTVCRYTIAFSRSILSEYSWLFFRIRLLHASFF